MDKSLFSGERQVAPNMDGIRRDHLARYKWAARVLEPGDDVLDIGCGVGYGCKLLADAGFKAIGLDDSEDSIAYARQYFSAEGISYLLRDVSTLKGIRGKAAVCFETLEHMRDPAAMLRSLRCKRLLVSVPNESVYKFQGQKFHFRHYRKAELEQLLKQCGWTVQAWYTQDDTGSDVRLGDNGWTLIADAARA